MRYLLFFNAIATMSESNSKNCKQVKENHSVADLAEEAIEALMKHMQFIDSPNTQKFIESQAELEKFVKELEEEAKKRRDQN